MKKYLAMITLLALVASQLFAQCPTYAHTENSGDITIEWERSGNTLYYHIIVETIDIFTPDPTPGDNYVGLELSALGWVWDLYYDAETFPYGHAEYCGAVDITGYNPAELTVRVALNVREPDRYNVQSLEFNMY